MSQNSIFKEICRITTKTCQQDSCLMLLESDRIAEIIEPGQFINVLPPPIFKGCVPPYRIVNEEFGEHLINDPSDVTMLRRPFSLYCVSRPTTGSPGTVGILFRIIGKGTRLIAGLDPGDKLDILGPLGKPYPLPITSAQPVFLIAGGFGVAPLLSLAYLLVERGNPIVFFWGVPSMESVPLALISGENSNSSLSGFAIEELHLKGIPSLIASDDGSGSCFHGTVCELFHEYIISQDVPYEEDPYIYTCGPELMMAKTTEYAKNKGWQCRVSLEKYMACGIGACLSCVCNIKTNDNNNHYQRTCTEGPSFPGEKVVWPI